MTCHSRQRRAVPASIARFVAEPLEQRTLLAAALVKDIDPRPAQRPIEMATPLGQVMVFVADTPAYGKELWKTDGTPGGTSVLKEVFPGPDSPDLRELTGVGGLAFFTATDTPRDPDSGFPAYRILWRTDGTAEGTQPVMTPGGKPFTLINYQENGATAVGTNLYFMGLEATGRGYGLWRTDGTPAGTLFVKAVYPPRFAADAMWNSNGRLFFVANDDAGGDELWTSDGTAAGTHRVKDIAPGTAGAQIQDGVVVGGGRLYFTALGGDGVRRAWVSDGTDAGTYPLVGEPFARSTAEVFQSRWVAPVGSSGAAIFRSDGPDGQELWFTDGTPGGARLLKDLNPGPDGSAPREFTVAGGSVYFVASDGGPRASELWISDGTPTGTVKVESVNPVPGLQLPYSVNRLTVVSNRLFFFGYGGDGSNSDGLWQTDGTASGTTLATIGVGPNARGVDRYGALLPFGRRVVFHVYSRQDGVQPWVSDGTPDGTGSLGVIPSPTLDSNPGDFAVVGGRVLFTAWDDEHWHAVRSTDGTAAGTVALTGELAFYDNITAAAEGGTAAYFAGQDDGTL